MVSAARTFFQRLPAFSLALLFSFSLLLFGLLLTLGVTLRGRTPASYLPARTLLILEERKGSPRFLSSLLSFPFLPLPQELQNAVTEERTVAIVPGDSQSFLLAFHRLISTRRAYQRALAYSRQHPDHAAMAGTFFVIGSASPPSVLLEPKSPRTLVREREFRALRAHMPLSPEHLLLLPAHESVPVLALPPFLLHPLAGAPVAALSSRVSPEGEKTITITAPALSPPSLSSSSFAALPRLPDLLFGVRGVHAERDFLSLAWVLAGEEEETLAPIVSGAAQAALTRAIGKEDLKALLARIEGVPYAFLLREGSGGTLEWLAAVETGGEGESAELLRSLEERFTARLPLARFRSRTLPSGKVVRDVVADPSLLTREEHPSRGYDVTILRHRGTPDTLASARKGGVLLLSDSSPFLRFALEALGGETPPVSFALTLTRKALTRIAPFLSASSLLHSLRPFLTEDGRMVFERETVGTYLQYRFVFERPRIQSSHSEASPAYAGGIS